MELPPLFGRLHPLVLHFPIALILLAAALEIVRLRWDRPAFASSGVFLLSVGAVGALVASATGWVFAHEAHPRPDVRWMLEWHRWLGVATTVLAGLAAWLAARLAHADTARARWLRRAIIWLTAVVLTLAAHLGALMVWGEDYFNPAD